MKRISIKLILLVTLFSIQAFISRAEEVIYGIHQRPENQITVDTTRFKDKAANEGADSVLKTITDSVASYNERLPVEKVYLHLDKPYYNIGDTVWFRAYVIDPVTFLPSTLSGVLYVELNNDTASNVRRISIALKNGAGWAQMPLSKQIFKEGGYNLRAYTNWMLNFGDDYIFKQRIYIGTPSDAQWLVSSVADIKKEGEANVLEVGIKLNQIDKLLSPVALKKMEVKIFDDWHYIYKKTVQTGIDGSLTLRQLLKEKTNSAPLRVQITSLEKADNRKVVQVPLSIAKNIDLQFLPEGGHLVTGLKSTIGFKAIGDNGRGTQVAGTIFEDNHKPVVVFSSLYNGMGSFEFTPMANKKYTARLDFPNKQDIEMPTVNTIGTVMHISNPEMSDNFKITLSGNIDSAFSKDEYFLIGTSGGIVYYSQQVNLNHDDVLVAKNKFPTGVVRFTLFKGKSPLNDRVVFVDHHDQLKIKVIPNKIAFAKRDSVSLQIEVEKTNETPGPIVFSLAVTDDSLVKPDSLGDNDITTSFLLNSELKGSIENAGYYINRQDKNAWAALDNLLLTQGWTGYNWGSVFEAGKPVKFEAEKEFKITGFVSNVLNKPIPNAEVIMSSQKPSFIATALTDSAGRYTFTNLPQIDSGSFFIQANNKRGRKMAFGNINVVRFTPPAIPQYKLPMMPWYINTDSTILNQIKQKIDKQDNADMQLSGIVLKEVEIRSLKLINGREWGPQNSDLAFDTRDIKESAVMDIYELLKQKLPSFDIINSTRLNGRAMVKMGKFVIRPSDITIDYGFLPIHIDDPYSREELIAELKEIKIATLSGLVVVWRPELTQGGRLPPSIMLFTKNGKGWFKFARTGTVTYRPLPQTYPKKFYSPKYGRSEQRIVGSDYRSTLYWNPNLISDKDGKAKAFFYTSDLPANYSINIQGYSYSGLLGSSRLKMVEQK